MGETDEEKRVIDAMIKRASDLLNGAPAPRERAYYRNLYRSSPPFLRDEFKRQADEGAN